MSPRSYSAYSNAYGTSASSYGVPSPGFLNGLFCIIYWEKSFLINFYLGMTNLMSSAFSSIGPFGPLPSTSSTSVTPYGQNTTNK